ncbi:lytic transglycosylase domain-containing protein [Bradyrhizobium sp. 193]|uniref:lytic transglycosylase domain-containing protein n=1 Tax=Bradyrhizobium sp. 193 TaxID=2782661 RepID=UPI003211A640
MSNRFAAFVDEASERFSVPVNWIGSVINIESAGDAHARSPKGAMGLMQIMPSTWAELRERHNLGRDPYDPRDNVLAGTAYLRELLDRYGGPAYLPRTMRDQLATKSISRAAHCQTRRKRMWPSLQLCLASSCLRRQDGRPAVIDSCNVVRRAIRSDEDTRSVVGAHSFKRRHDRNLGAPCFAPGTSAYWRVPRSVSGASH